MNTDLLADELATYALQKYAADDDEFSDDIEKQKSVDRKQKLKLALIGLGALGAGGAAAWALSGDTGKAIGSWIGGKDEPEPILNRLANPLLHGGAAAVHSGVARSGIANRVLGDVDPTTGQPRNAQLHVTEPTIGRRTGETLSDAGIAPRNTPAQITKDLGVLTKGPEKNVVDAAASKFQLYPATSAGKNEYKKFEEYTGAAKPDKGKEGKQSKQTQPAQPDPNAQQTPGEAEARSLLKAPISPYKITSALDQLVSDNASPIKAGVSGLYVRETNGKLVPFAASNLSAADLVHLTNTKPAAGERALLAYHLGADGVPALTEVNGMRGVELDGELNRAGSVTRTTRHMTPSEEVNLLMLRQQTAPTMIERMGELQKIHAAAVNDLAKAQAQAKAAGRTNDPILQLTEDSLPESRLLKLLRADMENTHHIGTFMETGKLPARNITPSYTDDAIQNLLRQRMTERAVAFQNLNKAMVAQRYQPGLIPAWRRAAISGISVGGLSAVLQQGAKYVGVHPLE